MSQINVPPTRMNLLRFKRSLQLVESGREILERKRDVLVVEPRNFAYDLQRTREELNERLKDALKYIEKAAVSLGLENVEKIAESTVISVDFYIDHWSVMGVTLPRVKMKCAESQPDYGFLGTNIYLDMAFKRFCELLDLICRLAELEESVRQIAKAVEDTQKRVNALKHIHIPRYRRLIKEIGTILEEREREEFVRMKKVKNMIARRRIQRERRG